MIENHMIVIFGGTGDLAKRKLIPALYNLFAQGKINDKVPIVGVSNDIHTKDEYVRKLEPEKFIPNPDKKKLKEFFEQVYYTGLDFKNPGALDNFADFLHEIDSKHACCRNKIFYLAVSPSLFDPVTDILDKSNLLKDEGWKRVIYEKPFGHDLESARKLNRCIMKVFSEDQVYRIDHYLGKELVQNIMVIRFANSIFEQIWNNKFIDNVQITISEQVGVELRGGYYDKAGAIRDMLQNHMMQILSLVAMQPPESMNADDIRDGKVKVLKSLADARKEDIVIGQYDKGKINDKKVPAYTDEPDVSPKSDTETYVAIKTFIDNSTWKGVPFYLRTGKRLAKRYSEVNLCLKDVTCRLFCEHGIKESPNLITIRIQPDEGVSLRFNAKQPGKKMEISPAVMDFCHKCYFAYNTPEAYEVLLEQIIRGDQTLFARWDEVEESWKFIEPIFGMIKDKTKKFPNYTAGSRGPKTADELLEKDGNRWVLSSKQPKDL